MSGDSLGRKSEVRTGVLIVVAERRWATLCPRKNPSSLRDLHRGILTHTWDSRPRLSHIAAPRLLYGRFADALPVSGLTFHLLAP